MRIVSSISLLHRDPILRDLKILYRDEPITDLSKLQFAVINTGASPIAEEDVKAFPTVDFGPNRQILVSRILREDPADLRCTVAADAARRNATLRFRLLNPTDIVEFVVYTAGPAEASPAVSARIKGVKRLEIVDKTTEKIDPQPRPHWSVYPVGVFLFLCVLLLPASVREYRMHVTARRFLREASGDPFAEMTEPVHFREFMPSLEFLIPREKTEISSLLDDEAEGWDERRKDVCALITKRIGEPSAPELFCYFFAVVMPLGVGYVFWQIIN